MKDVEKNAEKDRERCEELIKEGEGHMKFGVGIGVASAASLAIIGVTCPLCFFVAPAMVAVGAHKRGKAKRDLEGLEEPDLTVNWDGCDGDVSRS